MNKYIKTYEQLKDFYNINKSKFLIISEDEKWYIKGDEGNNDITIYPISDLDGDDINMEYLLTDQDSNDILYGLNNGNITIIVDDYKKYPELNIKGSPNLYRKKMRAYDISFIYSVSTQYELEELEEMSDEEIIKLAKKYDEDEDYSDDDDIYTPKIVDNRYEVLNLKFKRVEYKIGAMMKKENNPNIG